MPPLLDLCLIRPLAGATETPVLGVALLDEYLRFVASRCRPNTVLAAAYDLKVFFTVVGKQPEAVRPADVLAFVTAQRSGRSSIDGPLHAVRDHEAGGVSLRTVRRRLSTVSGLYAFLHARGDVSTNPVPRGSPPARQRLLHEASRARLRVRVDLRDLHVLPDQHRVPAHPPSPTRPRHQHGPAPPRRPLHRLLQRPQRKRSIPRPHRSPT
jgi:Phage integrase, N-terminal SAM-like domain